VCSRRSPERQPDRSWPTSASTGSPYSAASCSSPWPYWPRPPDSPWLGFSDVSIAEGGIPSPNIWHHPAVYEVENRAVDPDGVIEPAMRSIRDWAGLSVLDIG